MRRYQGLLGLCSFLLVSCSSGKEPRQTHAFTFTSPPLEQRYSTSLRPRTRERVQLLKTYPQAVFLRKIEVLAEPEAALEALQISFAEPGRHFRKLGLAEGNPCVLLQNKDFGVAFESGFGIALRSHEPLYIDATWQKPPDMEAGSEASCKLVFTMEMRGDLKALRMVLGDDGELDAIPESRDLHWPEPLR